MGVVGDFKVTHLGIVRTLLRASPHIWTLEPYSKWVHNSGA